MVTLAKNCRNPKLYFIRFTKRNAFEEKILGKLIGESEVILLVLFYSEKNKVRRRVFSTATKLLENVSHLPLATRSNGNPVKRTTISWNKFG